MLFPFASDLSYGVLQQRQRLHELTPPVLDHSHRGAEPALLRQVSAGLVVLPQDRAVPCEPCLHVVGPVPDSLHFDGRY